MRAQPAELALRYELTNSSTPGTETSWYVDLAKDLSLVNRRLYKQGMQYHVSGIEVVSRNTLAGVYGNTQGTGGGPITTTPGVLSAGYISVSTAPNTWITQMAHKRARTLYERQFETLPDNIKAATWDDFRVYLSDDHRLKGNMQPLDNGGANLAHGAWQYARFESPDGTTGADGFYGHLLGAHNGAPGGYVSVGLIKSYADGRQTVSPDSTSSTVDSDDPLINLFDDGTTTDERTEERINNGLNPPYGLQNYTGSGIGASGNKPFVQHHGVLSNGMTRMGGFLAPCGLLEFEITSEIANDTYNVLIRLKSGSYKGVAADSL